MTSKLTHAQLKVLYYLRSLCGPWGDRSVEICIKDIAAELSLNRSTVGRALSYLKEQGLIDMELVKVRLRVVASAVGSWGKSTPTEVEEPCDRHAPPCDRHAQECDRTIASSIYKYFQTFIPGEGEKKDAALEEIGEGLEGLTSLVDRLETLYKAVYPDQDLFSAVGFDGNIQVKAQGSATGFDGDIRVEAQGSATGFDGDIRVEAQGSAVGFDGNIQVEAQRSAVGFDGNIQVESQQGSATGFNGDIRVKAQGSAKGFNGDIRVKASKGKAIGFAGNIDIKAEHLEIWEVAPGQPDPVFLNWREETYKAQGGHWEANAANFAYRELYNNRQAATYVLWPQFMVVISQLTDNNNQRRANGMDVVLPSWFRNKRPLPTLENRDQLIANFEQIRAEAKVLPNCSSGSQVSDQFAVPLEQALNTVITPLEGFPAGLPKVSQPQSQEKPLENSQAYDYINPVSDEWIEEVYRMPRSAKPSVDVDPYQQENIFNKQKAEALRIFRALHGED